MSKNYQFIFSQRFSKIIEKAHEKTGKEVVILVDEYDKPLVGNVHNDENFEHYRRLFRIGVCFSSSSRRIEAWRIEG